MIDYSKIGSDIGKLVKEKQVAYGDSFGRSGRVLKELYPNGIPPESYNEVLTITRILDKLFRIASQKDAFGENPYSDIAGYAILAVGKYEDNHE
tara:strand:+ start:1725 stop:2006 length:282 start_codon:yes stop_codon:yes gene_type:complete